MKKILIFILITASLCSCICISSGATILGTGAGVIANNSSLIKSGICGQSVKFSDTDFKTALGISEFKKITILTLPSANEGVLKIGGAEAKVGQSVKRKNIATMEFTPKDASVSESSFTFSVAGTSEESICCRIRLIDRVNYAPKIKSSVKDTLSVTTQRGISVYGNFCADDPEADALDYIIVSAPKYGYITVTDPDAGEFKYTPINGFTGKDSFVFTVRDEFGNYSAATTVSIKIIERMSEVVFVDMQDSKNYNAAVAISAMGIMSGDIQGDDTYFSPDGTVSRAEFVAMAMKCLGIKADSTESATFFDDNSDIPKSLVGYVATAARCGIVNGAFENGELRFRPNDNITHYEAAVIMTNLLGLECSADTAANSSNVPVWARGQVTAMYSVGIFKDGEIPDMNVALNREDAAKYLYKLCST